MKLIETLERDFIDLEAWINETSNFEVKFNKLKAIKSNYDYKSTTYITDSGLKTVTKIFEL
jgi:hypothetical protein